MNRFIKVFAIVLLFLISCEKDKAHFKKNKTFGKQTKKKKDSLTPALLIAHAGGEIKGDAYSNSLEALNLNYSKGHRFFEIDFCWTRDGYLVLIHDWENNFREWFKNAGKKPTLKQFMAMKMTFGLTQMSFKNLTNWLMQHKDAYIVTDVKSENIRALKLMSKMSNRYQIIPQIYDTFEYDIVKKLGFNNIIFTLYRTEISDENLLKFVAENKLFALTMPKSYVSKELIQSLKKKGVFVYVHTINNLDVWKKLRQKGVGGLYTDSLTFRSLE